MPGPTPESVTSNAELPAEVDIVVIGAGIVGTSAALELRQRGLRVAICEKGHVAGEQSSRNWGWVRLSHRDRRELPLMIESVRLWQQLDQRLAGQTGYRQSGATYICASDSILEREVIWQQQLAEHGVPTRILDAAEVHSAFPGLRGSIKGALHNPQDGRAEPQQAAPAIARAFQESGGLVFQNCAVRVVETSAGRVSGVVTEKGRIACSSVLLASGVWSRLFLGNMGIHLPQLNAKGSVFRTEPIAGVGEGTLKNVDFAMRRRLDGGFTIASSNPSKYQLTPDSFRLFRTFLPMLRNEWKRISLSVGPAFFDALKTRRHWSAGDVTPFEQARVLDPAPDQKMLDQVLQTLRATCSDFSDARSAQSWAGYIDVLPDVIPVVSETEGVKNGVPGLHVASGFSGHGFGLGVGAGHLVADIIAGTPPIVDPAAFRLHRFSDGSKIDPMPNIL